MQFRVQRFGFRALNSILLVQGLQKVVMDVGQAWLSLLGFVVFELRFLHLRVSGLRIHRLKSGGCLSKASKMFDLGSGFGIGVDRFSAGAVSGIQGARLRVQGLGSRAVRMRI